MNLHIQGTIRLTGLLSKRTPPDEEVSRTSRYLSIFAKIRIIFELNHPYKL